MKCSNCDFQNPEEFSFCGKCGQKLSLEAPISQQSIVGAEGERKQATVIFSDLSGFTELSERLDPEEVKELMGRIFRGAGLILENYGGTVEGFYGDEVMAIFGVPRVHEDDPVRAIRAAREIHDLVNELSPKYQERIGKKLSMHTGINTGLIVTGYEHIGKDRYGLTGDTINLAKRLTSLAGSDEIIVGPDTYRHAESYYRFQNLEPTQVKGKAAPVQVYRVAGPRTHTQKQLYRPRLGLERQIYSEMVGRDQELNKLNLQVSKAIDGKGSVVNLIGEAGIGKSRLIGEFRNLEIMKRVAVVEGKSISIGKNLGFHPIIDLVKRWGEIREDDSDAMALSKLETALMRVCPDELEEILPFIATLMGMPLTAKYAKQVEGIEGESLQRNILKNLKMLLTKAAELNTLVILLEDVHWADNSSIELLRSLYRLAENQKILFVNVFRPHYPETGGQIVEALEDMPNVDTVEIALKPLNEKDSETLINNMLKIKGISKAIQDKVIRRSGGNPFFIEEVVRSFIDEGAVVKKNGAFEVTEKIDSVIVPWTINDVLMARIDRLEADTRNLVKVASVIGRHFFRKILEEVAQRIDDIDNRLSSLKNLQIILERERQEEIEYLFKHALAQEAAYESILLEQRKKLHLNVAEAIEKIFKENLREFYGMLAFHYSSGDDEEKAEDFLIKAGEEALKSSASSEALYFYQEALSLYLNKYGQTADSSKIAALEKNIAYAYFYRGKYTEANEYFDKVMAFHGHRKIDFSIVSMFKLSISFLYFLAGLYLPMIRWKKVPTEKDKEIFHIHYTKAGCLSVVDAEKFIAECVYRLWMGIRFDISKFEKGTAFFTGISSIFSFGAGVGFWISKKILRVIEDKVDMGDVYAVLNYETHIILHCFLSGDYELAKSYNDELINHGSKTIDIVFTAYLSMHARDRLERGDFSEALEFADKISGFGKIYEHELSLVSENAFHAMVFDKCRKIKEMQIELNQGIEFAKKTAFTLYLFILYSLKIRAQMLSGDIQGAERYLRYARDMREELSVPPDHLKHFLRGSFVVSLHRLEQSIINENAQELDESKKEAYQAGKSAVKNAKKVAFEQVEIYRLMGIYYWLIGKQKRAMKWWRKSIAVGERLSARPELSRTYMEVGKRLLEPQCKYNDLNGVTPKKYLEKARSMFEEMDLQWDLNELEKVEAAN